ncbi:MAG TPA: SBBP repeat-containing protein [bacterium]|nr:SBBP repeat-containing protein [bacterium]
MRSSLKRYFSLGFLVAACLTAGCNWSTSAMQTLRRTPTTSTGAPPSGPIVSVPGTGNGSGGPAEFPIPPAPETPAPETPVAEQPPAPPPTIPPPAATPPPPPPAAPAPLWSLEVGTASKDHGEAVAADASGNVYVAGWTDGTWDAATSGGAIDGFLVKYDADGNELWKRQFGGAGQDFALSLATDGQGDLYVAGQTTDAIDGEIFHGGGTDLFVRKYRPDGSLVWNKLLGTGDAEELTALAHWKESLYLAGRAARDIALWRLNQTDGAFDPAFDFRDFDGSPALDRVRDLAADPDGDLYVSGETFGDFPKVLNGLAHQRLGLPESYANRGGTDGFVMHLNLDMGLIDTFTIGSPQDDAVYGLTAPATTGVFLAGATMSADLSDPTNLLMANGWNRFVMNFARTGSRYASHWALQSGLRAPETALRLRVDGHGDVWVLGSEGDVFTDAGLFVTKYEGATGTALFDLPLGTPRFDAPAAIALDAAGGAFVTGFTRRTAGDDDVFVIGIGANGDLL